MIERKRAIASALCAAIMTVATPALAQQATTLASNSQPGASTASRYFGQSFLVTGSGTFDNVTFSFRDTSDTNVASGTLYIFNSECYACTPNTLMNYSIANGGTGTASMTAVNNVYTFDPTFTLTAGQTYYAYGDTAMHVAYSAAAGTYPDGAAYYTTSATGIFGSPSPGDAAFIVQGIAVGAAPEPASWALMVGGLGLVGGTMRRRRARKATVVPESLAVA